MVTDSDGIRYGSVVTGIIMSSAECRDLSGSSSSELRDDEGLLTLVAMNTRMGALPFLPTGEG